MTTAIAIYLLTGPAIMALVLATMSADGIRKQIDKAGGRGLHKYTVICAMMVVMLFFAFTWPYGLYEVYIKMRKERSL
jgi:hypothetical protein